MAMTADRAFSVSQVNEYIKLLLDTNTALTNIFVRGEISNYKDNYKTGHLYFSLKDEDGVLRAVMFKSEAMRLKFNPENGMKVIAHGRISAYPRDGQYQLYIDGMQPDGVGALYLAFEQLKVKLEAEGLFNPELKKPIPRFPKKIGIITSPTGAAVRDMIDVTGRRYPIADILLFPALVQGAEAAPSLISGIRYLNKLGGIDVIIIGRGGGSIEDLWAFNDETLARTVAASDIPIISAVGHETDFTICDFAADLRAPTPSAAAELAVPDISNLISDLETAERRMTSAFVGKINSMRKMLDMRRSAGVLSKPTAFFEIRRMDLISAENKLNSAIDAVRTKLRGDMKAICRSMAGLNPLSVLERGYGEVEDGNGMVISSVSLVNPGDKLKIRLSDGAISATVDSTEHKKEDGNG